MVDIKDQLPTDVVNCFFSSGYSEYFISLFSKMIYYLKCFEIVNEITPKIYDFILEFYNTKFYVVPLIGYVLK
jgi:hypothetical protein